MVLMAHRLACKTQNVSSFRRIYKTNVHQASASSLYSIQHRNLNFFRQKLSRWMFKRVFGNIDDPPQTETMEQALERIQYLEKNIEMLKIELAELKGDDENIDEVTLELDAKAVGLALFVACGCAVYGFISLSLGLATSIEKAVNKAKDRVLHPVGMSGQDL